MAKLQEPVISEADKQFTEQFVRDWKAGKFDDYEGDYAIIESGLTNKRIVEEFLVTGTHYDIDCPGGIDRLVKDYQAGKFDE